MCSSVSPNRPGATTIWIATYHPLATPAQGSVSLIAPSGTEIIGAFGDGCTADNSGAATNSAIDALHGGNCLRAVVTY